MRASRLRGVRRLRDRGGVAIVTSRSPEPLIILILPFGVLSVLSWGLAPLFVLIALVLLIRDWWRPERPYRERIGLTLLVLGAAVAWFLATGIIDTYHLLR